ncbi:ATP-binding protein [Streptomyces geranii]|uniref:ATP-binding protein n=1 Tax=Streptomyces geranii TaxID=2058923 RepID=UPI000D02EF2D|nr:ATP-binding protein [Streptomyces geranii]
MSTKEVDASARSAPVRRRLRGFADRWPFRRKLNVLVGIPLTVIAMLLAYLIVALVQESNRAEDSAQLVRDSAQVAQLVAYLQAEHQQAVLLSVRYEAESDAGTPSTAVYRQAQSTVDAQVRKVVDTFGDRLPDTEAQALKDVQALAGLRSTIEQGYLPASNIDPAYSGAADGLIDGLNLDRDTDLATTFTGNLLDSLLRADAAHGAYETGVFSAGTRDSNALIEFTGAVGSYQLFTYQAERFARFADDAQTDEFGGIEHNSWQAEISRQYAELAVDPSALQVESRDEIKVALRASILSYSTYRAQAEARLQISVSLIDQIADRAHDAATGAKLRAALLLGLALLGFALWIAFSILIRRSVVRPVMALTGAAREVADVAGRELARVADDDAEESGSPRLRQLPVTADDEIGELAGAFNDVQTTAAALLERQVLSRRNVAEMFGNVGRRVSNLTTRQLALIDAVERGETDPALLERLYSIDHIAVRLRRNADSLMLLAGIRETLLDSGPTALTNVVRAALGQIEGFRRVRLRAATEAMVEPDIIGDLTLMIAELLENAVSFSPEDSPVEVVVGSDHDNATITVSDHGLGMSAERLAEENSRLVRRERLDVVPTKVLGLFVVGALARRWDVEVTLSRTPGGGVTAEVMIPSTLLLPTTTEPARATTLAAPSTPAVGPSPSSTVPSWATKEDDTTSLPRRVPRRDDHPTELEQGEQEPGAAQLPPTPIPAAAAAAAAAADHDATTPVPTASASDSADTGANGHASGAGSNGHFAGTADSAPLNHPADAAAPGHAVRAGRSASTGPLADSTDAGSNGHFAATADSVPLGHPASADALGHPADVAGSGPPAGSSAGIPAPRAARPTLRSRAEDRPVADPFAVGPDGSRPLRRRVRGATLRSTAEVAAQQAARQAAVPPADADAVRNSLEEFEAAVARANRDTGQYPRPDNLRPDVPPDRTAPSDPITVGDTPHPQKHLPEGAEQ